MGVEGTMHIPVNFSSTLFIILQYSTFFFFSDEYVESKYTLPFPTVFTQGCLPVSDLGNVLVLLALGLNESREMEFICNIAYVLFKSSMKVMLCFSVILSRTSGKR